MWKEVAAARTEMSSMTMARTHRNTVQLPQRNSSHTRHRHTVQLPHRNSSHTRHRNTMQHTNQPSYLGTQCMSLQTQLPQRNSQWSSHTRHISVPYGVTHASFSSPSTTTTSTGRERCFVRSRHRLQNIVCWYLLYVLWFLSMTVVTADHSIIYAIPATESSRIRRDDVTLVTHLSVDHMDRLLHQLAHW